ncbi:MAG: Glycine-rich cell wall structural protein precursor [Labilithrix sp.]|nr:Glycine-rich cell wall structural protein precursor [Labilithrix sp.]
MKNAIILVAGALASFLVANCGSDAATCDELRTCGSSGTSGGPEGGADANVPDGCDAAAEPKDAPKCVVNDFGVFVDANGNDANAGTKESPVKTITAALGKLAGKTRVYVCEGTYAEHVKLTTAVSVYGGFACGGWDYTGAKPKVAPTDVGYALEVADVASALTIVDMSFVAADAVAKGDSSVAAFAHGAGALTINRSELKAGLAQGGADGDPGVTGAPVMGDLKGNPPKTATVAGEQKVCTCTTGGTSTGAAGGGPNGAGAKGGPPLAGGAGGLASTDCSKMEPNGIGDNGDPGTPADPGAAATALGKISLEGWQPGAGGDGKAGTPGQGGGGGGGLDALNAGAGGGCGGCGGSGGRGGKGGGASIALIAIDSKVTITDAALSASVAGDGGGGGPFGPGGAGGTAGLALCSGGTGGKGGDGGSGGGGAGGISAAVLYKGGAPTNNNSTLTPGKAGGKGVGGTPGMNDGVEGKSADMLEVQ